MPRDRDPLSVSPGYFRRILDGLLEGCQIVSPDWRYLYLNEAAARHARRPTEELLGRSMLEAFPGIDQMSVFAPMRACLETGEPSTTTHEFIYPDGELAWFELRVQRIPEGLFVMSLDVTDRKMAEVALYRANLELSHAYDATIEGWSRALELRDHETHGHTERVTTATLALARAAGIDGDDLAHVRRGALLHDIGKIGVPDTILRKPGPLTDSELAVMRRHPRIAYELLSPVAYLRPALDIPYCHHERWDGTGYPRALKADKIPIAARLFAVVDVWDSLRIDRPYRRAWDEERVLDYIEGESGRHFDPEAVRLFLDLPDRSTAHDAASDSL